jgi:hypothetical protein
VYQTTKKPRRKGSASGLVIISTVEKIGSYVEDYLVAPGGKLDIEYTTTDAELTKLAKRLFRKAIRNSVFLEMKALQKYLVNKRQEEQDAEEYYTRLDEYYKKYPLARKSDLLEIYAHSTDVQLQVKAEELSEEGVSIQFATGDDGGDEYSDWLEYLVQLREQLRAANLPEFP